MFCNLYILAATCSDKRVVLLKYRLQAPVFFPNFVGEVWIQPGQEPSQGALYRAKQQGQLGEGGVSLVLGEAGCEPSSHCRKSCTITVVSDV
jgi:hypothetical protein